MADALSLLNLSRELLESGDLRVGDKVTIKKSDLGSRHPLLVGKKGLLKAFNGSTNSWRVEVDGQPYEGWSREELELVKESQKDYGCDPLGDGKFKMVPSGDVVGQEEKEKRLGKGRKQVSNDIFGMSWDELEQRQGGRLNRKGV